MAVVNTYYDSSDSPGLDRGGPLRAAAPSSSSGVCSFEIPEPSCKGQNGSWTASVGGQSHADEGRPRVAFFSIPLTASPTPGRGISGTIVGDKTITRFPLSNLNADKILERIRAVPLGEGAWIPNPFIALGVKKIVGRGHLIPAMASS